MTWIERSFPLFQELSKEEKEGFLSHLKILVWEKDWIGAQGFELGEQEKVKIAIQGARIARGLPLSIFSGLKEWVIYEGDFVVPEEDFEEVATQGQAHHFGTVVLSWEAVLEGIEYPCMGFQPVHHELAHILDLTTGVFNGTPLLEDGGNYESWTRVFQQYFEEIRANPEESFLDLYGAQDEAEFFAVATEAFFSVPDHIKKQAPELYEELVRYYGVKPRAIACCCEEETSVASSFCVRSEG